MDEGSSAVPTKLALKNGDDNTLAASESTASNATAVENTLIKEDPQIVIDTVEDVASSSENGKTGQTAEMEDKTIASTSAGNLPIH